MFICCFWMFTFPYMTTAQFNKKEIALNISCENVYDVILLTPSNRYVKLISKEVGLEPIITGGYKGKGYSDMIFQNSVVFQDQQPIILPKYENFIYSNVTENKLFTTENYRGTGEVSFKLYNLENKNLSLINEVIKPIPYSILYNTKGNIVVLTDYDECFGRTIDIYTSDNFNAKTSIKPFGKHGFEDVTFFEDELFLYALFKPVVISSYPNESIKIYQISLSTGEILQEKVLSIPLNIVGFYVTDEYFIMYSYNKVIAYNYLGDQVWGNDITIHEIKADIDEEILYLGLSDMIVALNLENGQPLWKSNFLDFYMDKLMGLPDNMPNINIRPVFFDLIDNQLAVIISQTSYGTVRRYQKYLTKLFVFDSEGNITATKNILSSETKLFRCFFQNMNSFTVFSDSAMIYYEK